MPLAEWSRGDRPVHRLLTPLIAIAMRSRHQASGIRHRPTPMEGATGLGLAVPGPLSWNSRGQTLVAGVQTV